MKITKLRLLPGAKAQVDEPRLLRLLLGQLDGMVYRCRDDASWTMEFVSDGCSALTGYRTDELLLNSRISYDEITHPDDRVRVRAAIGDALRAHREFSVEYRIVRADGEVRWVWDHGAGLLDADGHCAAVQGFIQDITLRHEQEHALMEAE